MSTNLVFANATGTHFDFKVVDNSSSQNIHTFGCDANSTASGTVSGASGYSVLFTPGGQLSTPQFTGDTEITFVVFIQPVTESNEPLTEEDSAAPPADSGSQY
ncbi:MAG: hypothetical protein M3367_05885 [Acidobacteriota bacterium]|nr:hypothetical protein [Acidobacteriota bacterium]